MKKITLTEETLQALLEVELESLEFAKNMNSQNLIARAESKIDFLNLLLEEVK